MSRFRTVRSLIVPLVFLAAAWTTAAQDESAGVESALAEAASDAWARADWDAAAAAVGVESQALFASADGDWRGKDATADAALPAAPLAHSFLCAVVLSAVQSDRVALDDELGDLLPDLVGADAKVAVRHLLNHTSGFVDCHDRDPLAGKDGVSIWSGLRRVVREPLETKPGECVAPTTTNTLLLAALVEHVEGRPARDVIEADLFAAFGMEDSSCRAPSDAVVREAAGEVPNEEVDDSTPAADFDPAWLRVSASDLLKYQRGLLDHELFGVELWREMTAATRLRDGGRSPIGFGVRQVSVGGEFGVRAGGADDAGAAFVAYFPEHDLTVVAIARGADGDLEDVVDALALIVMAPPAPPIRDLPLDESERAPYLGLYQIGCNQLRVFAGGERVVLEDAARGEQVLLYQGEHRFVLRDEPGVSLTFRLDGDRAESFVLDDHGVEAVATRFD